MAMNKPIIVIGAGRFGSDIACKLNYKNRNVVIIDIDSNAFNNLNDFSGYIVNGDALDNDVLEQNGIKDAKAVIIATNSDNINVYLADLCFYLYNVENVYVKLNDSRKGVLLDKRVKVTCPFILSMNEFDKYSEVCAL